MTGLSVSERFSNHKAGKKAAWVVKKYGDRLVPELYEQLNPMPYQMRSRQKKHWPSTCGALATL